MFLNDRKLAQIITLASLAFNVALADEESSNAGVTGIVSLQEDDDIAEMLKLHEFTVISFFNSDDHAIEIDSLMDGAKAIFDKKVADREWPERSLGWYRADLEKYP